MQDYIRASEGHVPLNPSTAQVVGFRITGVWSDGLDITEEHPTWSDAQDFVGELMGVNAIVKIIVEKLFA